MKPLIIYYSHSGNNEKLALKLKDRIGCPVLRLNEKKKRRTISILFDYIFNRSSKLSGYRLSEYEHDVFILVAPVWSGRLATPMRVFAEKERSNMHKYFFITLCNGLDRQKEKIIAELSSIVQSEPLGVTELWINRLLPADKQNKIKHTFNYKVSDDDFDRFEDDIKEFIETVNYCCETER
jgi:flavodoxin